MGAEQRPEAAVVIATRERETRLAFCLEALAAQSVESARFEVVVVRPAGQPGPRAAAPEGLRVRFLEHRGEPGPGAQRNTGWRASEAPLVAFTDDDCRPEGRWLERLMAATDGPQVFVQGRTAPDPDEAHLLLGLSRSIELDRPSAWYETCNIAYPRELLERLGGFDERFRFSAEDADLGLRAREAGANRVFEQGALVHHAVVPNSLPRALRATVARDSTPLLIVRHPLQRRELYVGVFHGKSHATVLLALIGILVARRRPLLGVALVVPHVARYADRRQLLSPRGIARIAVFVTARGIVDAAEIAVTARAALRNRVLVL